MNQEQLYQETKMILQTLFSLPEIRHLSIKGIAIPSMEADTKIRQGIDRSYHDKFSDVDIKAEIMVSREEWLCPVPYYQQHFSRLQLKDMVLGCSFSQRGCSASGQMGNTETMRICLDSGFRMDLLCMLRQAETAQEMTALQNRPGEQAKPEKRDHKADHFWFVAVQALGKLYRRDYLIADHLTHMLLMEGLVLQMEERDRRFHTNIHRYGGREDLAYRKITSESEERMMVKGWIKEQDNPFQFIANRMVQAVSAYDLLKKAENPGYAYRMNRFLTLWREYSGF